MQETIAVGLSGGVDSGLTALLLKEKGYNVVGLSMSIYNKDIPNLKLAENSCYGSEEKKELKELVAWGKKQGITAHVFDCAEIFKKTILKYFKEAYLNGVTPNPCIMCNHVMKFGVLLNLANENGIQFSKFATGHYARIYEKEGRFVLQRGVDEKKDQSYFLYRLNQDQLSKIIFPLGCMTKEEVRALAVQKGLIMAEKPDSQDFYAGDYTDLLEKSAQKGNIILENGKVLGTHAGYWNYTIGQRKGLGIAHPVPLFVIDILPETNEVVVGPREETFQNSCSAQDIVWGGFLNKHECNNLSVYVKYRSTGKLVEATLIATETSFEVIFKEPQRAITAGQSIVCYDMNDKTSVICGGIIQKRAR